jgi:hypothetical protein
MNEAAKQARPAATRLIRELGISRAATTKRKMATIKRIRCTDIVITGLP